MCCSIFCLSNTNTNQDIYMVLIWSFSSINLMLRKQKTF